MEYLKVNLTESPNGVAAAFLARAIESEHNLSVASVEVCDDQPLTLPMVRTGILKSPSEICGCEKATSVNFTSDNSGQCCISVANTSVGIGKRLVVSDHVFPIEFYKDVTESIDWAQINEGDLLEVDYGTHKIAGYYRAFKGVPAIRPSSKITEQDRRYISMSIIKSIQIVERAK